MGHPALEPLPGSGLPAWEQETIRGTALDVGIDPRLLAALRKAENGGPGREFGVLSVPAPTYQDQALIAARTIRNTLRRYQENVGDPFGADGRVTNEFIEYFSSGGPGYGGYAPLGAENDPLGLNRFHARNVSGFYGKIETA